MSSRAIPGILPITYHNGKRSKKARIMAIPFLNEFVQSVWPGTPTELWAGFMSNGGGDEDTVPASATIRFHEIGYFGIEAGPRDLPVPNSDTSRQNTWFRFHNHPKVIELLGRPACMSPEGCWKESNGGLRDQIAVGLVGMRYGQYEGLQRALRPEVRASSPSTFWAVVTTFMAWSAGYPSAAQIINRYAADLARVSEAQRWDTLVTLYAQDFLSNTVRSGPPRHGNVFYSLIRTQQKIAVGSNVYESNTVDDVIALGSTDGSVPSIQPSQLRVSPTSFTQPIPVQQIQRTTPPPVQETQENIEPLEESGKEEKEEEIVEDSIGYDLVQYTNKIIFPVIFIAVLAVGYAGYRYYKSRKIAAQTIPTVSTVSNPRMKIKARKRRVKF